MLKKLKRGRHRGAGRVEHGGRGRGDPRTGGGTSLDPTKFLRPTPLSGPFVSSLFNPPPSLGPVLPSPLSLLPSLVKNLRRCGAESDRPDSTPSPSFPPRPGRESVALRRAAPGLEGSRGATPARLGRVGRPSVRAWSVTWQGPPAT